MDVDRLAVSQPLAVPRRVLDHRPAVLLDHRVMEQRLDQAALPLVDVVLRGDQPVAEDAPQQVVERLLVEVVVLRDQDLLDRVRMGEQRDLERPDPVAHGVPVSALHPGREPELVAPQRRHELARVRLAGLRRQPFGHRG